VGGEAVVALKKIEHKAPRKQSMTLDDLLAFLQDARRSGAAGDESIVATVSIGGRLQALSVEIDVQPDPDAPLGWNRR
jgi:hypothetical protein